MSDSDRRQHQLPIFEQPDKPTVNADEWISRVGKEHANTYIQILPIPYTRCAQRELKSSGTLNKSSIPSEYIECWLKTSIRVNNYWRGV